jgi:hypothetical protein
MPGASRAVDGEGRVLWSDRHVGMGVQFEKIDAASQAIVDGAIDAHLAANRKSRTEQGASD